MAMQRPPVFEEEEVRETFLQRYTQKAIRYPFLTGGLIGLVGMLGLGTYKYRSLRASGMSTSIFLMQLRVAAQGMLVGSLAIAVLKDSIVELFTGENKKEEDNN